MTVIAQPDPRDGKSLPRDDRDYVAESAGGVEGWRVAFSPDLGFMPVEAEIAAIVREAAGRFETLGAHVEAVAPPFDDPIHIFNTIWSPVLAAGLKARFSDDRLADLGDETGQALEEVKDSALEDFVEAERQRDLLAHRMRAFHETFDLLLTPTAIVSPFGIAHAFPPEWDRERSWVWELPTFPFNFSRQPAATVPCGFTAAGLPVGLQIVGPIYDDARTLRAARAYQEAYPTTDRRPPLD